MGRFLTLAATIGCVLLLTGPYHPAALGQDKAADKEKILGKWSGKLSSLSPRGAEEYIEVHAQVGAEDFTMEISENGKKGVMKVTYKLWSDTNPKGIDLVFMMGTGKTSPGIYVIEGDDLKICWDASRIGRPIAFALNNKLKEEERKAGDPRLLALKRQK